MSLPTRIRTRLRSLSRDLTSAMAHGHQARTRGHCPHCEATTPWLVRPMGGLYRCLRCDRDPLASDRASAAAAAPSPAGRRSPTRVRRVVSTLMRAATAVTQALGRRAATGLSRAFRSAAAWSARANAAASTVAERRAPNAPDA